MKIIDSSILEEWYAKEYSCGKMRSIFGPVRPDVDAFIEALPAGLERGIELGCGDGRNLVPLCRKVRNLCGVDVVDGISNRNHIDECLSHIEFHQADILEFRPLDRHFDVVLCTEVLHFFSVSELENLIQTIVNSVKSGGYLFVDILADLTRYFTHNRESFTWSKEASVSMAQAEELLHANLAGFTVLGSGYLFDRQNWPLTSAENLPILPYTWQGTYVSIFAQRP